MVAIDDMFVMQALSKYDLYSMARGIYSKCKVAAVQTNDDAKEEEIQTDDVSAGRHSSRGHRTHWPGCARSTPVYPCM